MKVQVKFQGLIAAVRLPGDSAMQILLVEAREGGRTSTGDHVPPHYPVVQFNRNNVRELFAPEDGLQKVIYWGKDSADSIDDLTGLWFLDRQDLSLDYERNGKKSSFSLQGAGDTPGNHADHNGGSERLFRLLPHLEDIAVTAARIDPDCLLPRPRQNLVAARFKIEEGVVNSLAMVRDRRDDSPVQAHFRPLGSESRDTDFLQPTISAGIQLELDVPGESVTLVTTDIDSGETKPFLKLGKAPGQGDNELIIHIMNLPLTDLFELPVAHPHASVDTHFELFYELSKTRLPLRRRPVPHFVSMGTGNGGSHSHEPGQVQLTNPFCPPVVFQG